MKREDKFGGRIGESEEEQAEKTFEKEVDNTVLLASILAELKQIRAAVTDADATTRDDADAEYRCTRCPGDKRVAEDKRVRHARSEHNAPPGEEAALFERVE